MQPSNMFGAETEALTVAEVYSSTVHGKTILITGVNKRGIGYATAQAFASQSPRHVIIAGRSIRKLEECFKSLASDYPDVDFRLLQIDLSSQSSVREAAEEVLNWSDVPQIDIVVNNAGVMLLPQRVLSEDDVEMHLATNHVGHFLLTTLLMPKILTAAAQSPRGATRIINVSSYACLTSGIRSDDLNFDRPATELLQKQQPNFGMMKMAGLAFDESMSYIPMAAYGQSKTANVLFTVALNKRLYGTCGILSLVLHPGEVDSELQRHTDRAWHEKAHKAMGIKTKTPQQGASTTLWAALAPELASPSPDQYNRFLSDCKISALPPHVTDVDEAENLWSMTERIVCERFQW